LHRVADGRKVGGVTTLGLDAYMITTLRMAARAADMEKSRFTDGWRYKTFAALVLAEGRWFTLAEVDNVPDEWRGPSSTCHLTAGRWSREAGVIYVEGWAATGVTRFGLEHAWCARPGDPTAYDPTWPPGSATGYIGLPVTASWRATITHPRLLTLEHDTGRALLREGLPAAARVDTGVPIADLPIPL
jgi:hypothetical protein